MYSKSYVFITKIKPMLTNVVQNKTLVKHKLNPH